MASVRKHPSSKRSASVSSTRATINSPSTSRKRPFPEESSSTTTSTLTNPSTNPSTSPNRPQLSNINARRYFSPSKVHFGKGANLIQGPTASRRSVSPQRGILSRNTNGDDWRRRTSSEGRSSNFPRSFSDLFSGMESVYPECESFEEPVYMEEPPAKRALLEKPLPRAVDRMKAPRPEDAKSLELLAVDTGVGTEEDNGKDEEICRRLADLVQSIHKFSKKCGEMPAPLAERMLNGDNFGCPSSENIEYTNRLADGGRGGSEGWTALLTDVQSRQALSFGMIGQVLKEHVFGTSYFGCAEEQEMELEDFGRKHVETDGFDRTRMRAEMIRSFAPSRESSQALEFARAKVTEQLVRLLDISSFVDDSLSGRARQELAHIIDQASSLSRAIRIIPDVIYQWAPAYKDEEFVPSTMEVFNLRETIRDSPLEKQTTNGKETITLKAGHEHRQQALVHIICFPGLVAYRPGGGKLGEQQLKALEKADSNAPPDVQYFRQKMNALRRDQKPTEMDGLRTKRIYKSIVMLRWGRQRLLTREAGTSVHVQAMKDGKMGRYEEDDKGYKSLWEVVEERYRAEWGN